MNEYYVYALVDPRDNSFFYIGKGKGNRYLDHIKDIGELNKKHSEAKKGINPSKLQKMKSIIASGSEVNYKIIADNLTEESAYTLEEVLVERFGRQITRTGHLTNLEPGGKWAYPKIVLEENEKTTITDIQEKYPELIEILERYPHIAHEPPIIIPWFKKKIPKEEALFQYTIEGDYIATHYIREMTFATGMSSGMIKAAIKTNQGFIFDFQWSYDRLDKMRNLTAIDQNEFNRMKKNVKFYKRREVTFLEGKKNYENRIQEVF